MATLPVLLQIHVCGHCPAFGRGVPCSVEVFLLQWELRPAFGALQSLSEWGDYLNAGNCIQSVQQATLMEYPPISFHITVPEAQSDLVCMYPTQLCLPSVGKL